MIEVIVLLGPTGVGKSAVAIELAKRLNGEVISADSMQIYKKLCIGTAKVTDDEKQNIPHHLIDVREFNESYNAHEFVVDCKAKISEIAQRGKTPIIVGGTNLYISALVKNYDFKNGQLLAQDDIIYRMFCLTMPREKLYDRINRRVDKMLSDGLIAEVEGLKQQGLTVDMQSGKSIGYRELLDYLDGMTTLEYAVDKIKQHSRNYAKRQLTWLRSMEGLILINAEDNDKVNQIMQYLKK